VPNPGFGAVRKMYRPLLASRARYKVQGIFSFLSYMDGLAPVGLDNSKPGVS